MTDIEALLRRAKEQEKTYDWLEASETYSELLRSGIPDHTIEKGELAEAKAYALFKHAFQARDHDDFASRMNACAVEYSEAQNIYRSAEGENSTPYLRRCDAMTSYIDYWLAADVTEKKKAVNESWRGAKEALANYDDAGDGRNYGKTFNQLSPAANLIHAYGEEGKALEETLRPAIKCGERAIEHLSHLSDPEELATAYAKTSALLDNCSALCDWKEVTKYNQRMIEYFKKAHDLSEVATLIDLSSFMMGGSMPTLPLAVTGTEEAMQLLLKRLEYAEKTKDALVKCCALSFLAGEWNWRQSRAQDSEELELNFNQALHYSLASQEESAIMSMVCTYLDGELWPAAPHSGLYGIMAYFGCDFLRVREFAERAVAAAQDQLKLAESSGYRWIVGMAHHQYSYNLTSLARTETDLEKRQKLLSEGLEHGKKAIAYHLQFYPRGGWGLGTGLNLQAETEFELASVSPDADTRRTLLRDAAEHRKDGLEQNLKMMTEYDAFEPWRLRLLGRWYSGYGATLERLHEVEENPDLMKSAAEAYDTASGHYEKCGHPSRAAEACWKAAIAYDSAGEFVKSSKRYSAAAGFYRQASEKIPQLRALYRDYSTYMQAWDEIGQARNHHMRQDTAAAMECYRRASKLLESTERWRVLAQNYLAWAEIEQGENLSRKDSSREAISAFERAAQLFTETKESLRRELARTQGSEEKDDFTALIEASDLRREYCLGRTALEEARVLDKQGDEFGACERFGSAAETFSRIQTGLESGRDQREIQLMMILAKAWQTMAKAEAEASPHLYRDASDLFDKARELGAGERAKLLAAGHSRLCKALEAGMRFAETGDVSLHAAATQDLESAAILYLRAGLVNDSEYVKASRLLLDAYVYMARAAKEEDQTKKARLYAMTEKVLEASAASYSKAEYPKKRDQVARLLDKVKGERELADTLAEVLRAPDLVSSTATLVAPAPSGERAVGLQRFERAHLEANAIAQPVQLRVGEDTRIEIELVNAGGGPAQLAMVESVIPPGFEVVSTPERCRIEENSINLRGRKLDPLESDVVSLVIRPLAKGNFTFTPRILYVDESGKHKTVGSKQITLTVKELGVGGWLKGPERNK